MSANPIPKQLETEFLAVLDAANNDDLPDGAWLAVLGEAAEGFIKQRRILGADAHDAVLQWVQARS